MIIKNNNDLDSFIKNDKFIQKYKKIQNGDFYLGDGKLLPEYEKTKKWITESLKRGDDVLLITDYDADGVLSGYIHYINLVLLKGILGSKSKIRIKSGNRGEGYGLSNDFFKSGIWKKYQLIITTDVGISVRYPKGFLEGRRLIIFDHHLSTSNMIFLCKEVREKIEKKYPLFGFQNRKLTSEEKVVILKEIKKDEKLVHLIENISINNYIIYDFDDYFYGLKSEGFIKDIKNKKNEHLKSKGGDLSFYVSAGQVGFLFWKSFLSDLINEGKLKKEFSKIFNVLLLIGSITTITDVMDLESSINLSFNLLGTKVYKTLKNDKKRKSIHSGVLGRNILSKNFCNIAKEHFFSNYKENEDINEYLKYINGFLHFLSSFGDSLSRMDIGFKIGPYINSYGRLSTPHEIFLQLLGKEEIDNFYNEKRKNIQNYYFNKALNGFQENENEGVVLFYIENENDKKELKENNNFTLSKCFWKSKYFNIFEDFSGNEGNNQMNNKEELGKISNSGIEGIIGLVTNNNQIKNKEELRKISNSGIEGIIGLVASKLQGYFEKPSMVFEKVNDNLYKGSGRSDFPFFKFGLTQLDSVILAGGHDSAFGIVINNFEKFKKDINEIYRKNIDKIEKKESDKMIIFKIDINNKDYILNVFNFIEEYNGIYDFFIEISNEDFSGSDFGKGKHYKLVNGNIEIMLWNIIQLLKKYSAKKGKLVNINNIQDMKVFKVLGVSTNYFGGKKKLQFSVGDIIE